MFSHWPHFISTAPGVAYAYVDDYRRNRRDIFNAAPTLDALAEKLSISAAALADSVRKYNQNAGNRPKLSEGPYVALGPLRAVFVHAEGGLAVDREHRVLGEGDKPIAGPLCRRLDRAGRTACSKAMAIISAGPSRPAGVQAATRRAAV